MFRRWLPRTTKLHALYIFMTTVLGITLYFTLFLHLSQTCIVTLMDKRQNFFAKRSNIKSNFLWYCFVGFPDDDGTKFRNSRQNIQRNYDKIVINSGTMFSHFNISKLFNRYKNSNFEIQNIVQIIKNGSKNLKKDIETAKLNRMTDLFGFQSSSIPNWLSANNRSIYHPPMKQSKYLMSVTNHSCQPLYPQVVLYNRIFKTASTTMSSFLEKCGKKLKYVIKKELTEQWSNRKRSHPIIIRIRASAKNSKRRYKRLLAVAHFYFRIDSGIKMKHTYINLLREPIDRFISHYYYARSPHRWPKKLRKLKAKGHWNVTLEECLEKQYEGCKWNVMTRFFCGPEAFCATGNVEALSRAKYNMLHYYSSIGVVEHLNEFIEVLHKRLRKFIIKRPKNLGKKFVTTGVKKRPISDKVMARIIQANQADIELYKYAKSLFLKQAKQCGIKIKI